MAEGGLSYKIELDSADAEQAFGRLQGASLGLLNSLEQMASAVSGGGLAAFAAVAVTATAAVGGLTTALFGMAKASASAVDELGDMAAQMGTTIEKMSTLQGALVQFQANGATLQRAFEKLGNAIQASVDSTAVDEFVKTLIGSAGPAVRTLNDIGGSFEEVSRRTPQLETVLLKTADAFEKTKDATFNLAVATKLFGKRDAQSMVESLSVGSAAIKEQQERMKALGFEITKADEAISNKFIAGMNRLEFAIGRTSTQFGLLFQPAFTSFLDGLSTALENNRGNIIAWGQAIADTVGPVLQSLGRAIAGTAIAGKDDWAVSAVRAVKLFGEAVQAVIVGGVIPAFRGLVAVFQFVADSLNSALGTSLKAIDVFLLAVTARIALTMLTIATRLGPVGLALLAVSVGLGVVAADAASTSTALEKTDDAAKQAGATAQTTAQQTAQAGTTAAAAWQQATGGFRTYQDALLATQASTGQVKQAVAEIGPAAVESSSQGQTAVDGLNTSIQAADTSTTQLNTSFLGIAWDSISSAGVSAWNSITSAIGRAIDALLKFIGLRPSTPAAAAPVGGLARGGLLGGRGTGTSDSNLAWLSRGEYVMPANAVRQPGVLAFLEALRRSGKIPAFAGGGLNDDPFSKLPESPNIEDRRGEVFVDFVDAMRRALRDAAGNVLGREAISEMFSEIMESVISQTMDSVIIQLKQIAAAIREIVGAHNDELAGLMRSFREGIGSAIEKLNSNISKVLDPIETMAGGGLLGGRGTGTSDSNLAWVSRGEHIMPARAVRQPGVLAFLEALRRSGGNLRDVIDGMGRFALGGMVRAPIAIPAFAGGGMSRDLGTLTLGLPGGGTVSVHASSDAVDQLRKAAAMAQVRSGGRKPSRYS